MVYSSVVADAFRCVTCPHPELSARVALTRLGRGLAYSFEIDVIRYDNVTKPRCADAEAPNHSSCGGHVPFTRTVHLFRVYWLNNRSPR